MTTPIGKNAIPTVSVGVGMGSPDWIEPITNRDNMAALAMAPVRPNQFNVMEALDVDVADAIAKCL